MSMAKIEKLLALAYGTSNKEEAAVAFGRAVAYANQAGIDLRTVSVPGAPKPEPQRHEYRRSQHSYQDPFSFGGGDAIETIRLRLALQKEQEDHQITKLAHQAEIEAHTKTCEALHTERCRVAERDARIEGVRQDVLNLNQMCAQHLHEKNQLLEHKDYEIAALKRQISLLQAN